MKLTIFGINFLLFFTGRSSVIKRDSCEPGWDLPEYNLGTKIEYCYKFYLDQRVSIKWYEAWRDCRVDGGEPLVVESATESELALESSERLAT